VAGSVDFCGGLYLVDVDSAGHQLDATADAPFVQVLLGEPAGGYYGGAKLPGELLDGV
jgi:hypothetical protein